MKRIRTKQRTIGLACLTLIAAAVLTATGVHWVSTSDIFVTGVIPDPTGSSLVVSIFDRRRAVNRTEIRDLVTGEVCCDLGKWSSAIYDRHRWSPNGKMLIAACHEYDQEKRVWATSVVLLDVSSEKPRLVQKWPISPKHAFAFGFDSKQRVVYVVGDSRNAAGRGKLEVVRAGAETLSEIELGKDEAALLHDLETPSDEIVFEIQNLAWQSQTKADVLAGMQELERVTIVVSPDSGQIIEKRSGPKRNDSKNLVANAMIDRGPIAISDDRYVFVIYELAKPGDLVSKQPEELSYELLVINDKTASRRRIKLQPKQYFLAASPSGQILLVTEQGNRKKRNWPLETKRWPTRRLVRLDLETEEQALLVNYQRGTRVCGIATIVGVPLMWLLFLILTSRDISPHPFLDMAFLLGVSTIMSVLWCALGLRSVVPADPVTIFAAIYGIAIGLFGVAWVFHSNAMFRVGLPSLIIAFAGCVAVVLFWSQGDTWHAFEESAAGAILIGWQLFGLTMYRMGGGRLIRTDEIQTTNAIESNEADVRSSQISMRHVMFFVGACALLFAVLRFLRLDEGLLSQIFTQYAVWVVSLVGLAAALSIAALRCVVYVRRVLLSLICYLAIAALACAIHYFATSQLDSSRSAWNLWVRYSVVSAAGFLNWCAFAYCMRHLRWLSKQEPTNAVI